jgi:hypothetical protein
MLPAVINWFTAFQHLQQAVLRRLRKSPDGTALVSVLFAHPDSVVVDEIHRHTAYLNDISGKRWDLYLAGYQSGLETRQRCT